MEAEELSRKLNVLFWVSIISLIVQTLSNENIGGRLGVLDAASYSGPIITAIYGIILFQAGKKNRRYRMSGTVLLVTAGVGIVLNVITLTAFFGTFNSALNGEDTYSAGIAIIVASMGILLVSAATAIMTLYAVFQEIKGHSEIIRPIDCRQSDSWNKLLKWMVAGYVCVFGGLILITLSAYLALALALAASVIMLVTGIIKIVYLHRMVVAFRDYDDTELTVYEAER